MKLVRGLIHSGDQPLPSSGYVETSPDMPGTLCGLEGAGAGTLAPSSVRTRYPLQRLLQASLKYLCL